MVQRPRGTRDFAPAETASRHALATGLREVFRRFAYHEVQTPTFEELELFTAKSGEGIIKELYAFKDKGERDLTLRPELTAPVMRMYFQDHAFEPKPIKWFYFGNCFRYDRPQAARYREFWQFGCEQIGAGTPLAYAELIALADACFDAAGLQKRDFAVGHVALLRLLVDSLGLSDEARPKAMRLIDKRDDEGLIAICTGEGVAAGLVDRLLAVMDARSVHAVRELVADLEGASDPLAELGSVFDLLASFDVDVRLNLGIARGLDYYTGIVFECHSASLGAESQLLGGGGYDLSAVFSAQPTPTMGFGLGFDRLLVALEAEGGPAAPPAGPEVFLAALGDAATQRIVALASQLRARGVVVELDLTGRKPGAAAKHADALGAQRLVILGDRDIEAGAARVKDLKKGTEVEVALDKLVAHLSG